ncbi:hypothetical protein BDZ90DRAFT_229218 [Jaminaea rosea]|uniref:DNA/RNA-binding domain-containing protein n=1 Tax=Jaminaea rosea TaxID=1569628 RepID=A0A316UZK8_9BASI|nr:hypothetical protein BDZ90DRAFT_229218 [Jaminaea rosea]PWN30198.1 hypothetical protein BDZ90DRAFT_229218 [Jaminaea rosea]
MSSSSSDSDHHEQGSAAASSPSSRGDEVLASSAAPVQSSARSSSDSLRTLRNEMATQLADKNVHLTPSLGQGLAFTRNQLRNAYLRLLFHAPFTKQAHNAEAGMWTETTHKVVAIYRSRLAKLEKQIKASANIKDKTASGSSSPARGSAETPSTPPTAPLSNSKRRAQTQEYSRLAEALRNFLAKEEIFWKALAERLSIVFRLTETEGALDKAGIISSGPKIPVGPRAIMGGAGGAGEDSQPAGLARMPDSPSALDAAIFKAASLPRHKERLLEIVFKILLYCGDLARYREIYRDLSSVNSPTSAPPTQPRSGRTGQQQRRAAPSSAAVSTSQRDFTPAIVCYEAARLLLPSEGNPSNQLAVVSTYQSDTFGAVYHYYRALCVKRPFDTSKVNLGAAFGKAVDAWLQAGGLEASIGSSNGAGPRRRSPSSNELKHRVTKDFVVLQGLFFTHKSFTSLPTLAVRFLETFGEAVSDKLLSTDIIVRVVVVGIAASWSARLWRRSVDHGRTQTLKHGASSHGTKEQQSQQQDPKLALSIELQLLHHAIGVFRLLLDICATQVRQAIEDAKVHMQPTIQSRNGGPPSSAALAEGGVAKHMTAVMRRVLPALRISSKWVKAHLDYIDRCESGCISRAAEGFADPATTKGGSSSSDTTLATRATAELSLIQGVEDFWSSYVECLNTLRFAFPFDSLPSLGTVGPAGAASLSLEEDVDLRGFVPTRRGMLTQDDAAARHDLPSRAQGQGGQRHPNEEHLMRIADLLVDAKVVAESEASPILFDDARGTFRVDPSGKAGMQQPATHPASGEAFAANEVQASLRSMAAAAAAGAGTGTDDAQSLGSSTEDVVDMAMRHVAEQRAQMQGGGHHLPNGLVSDDDEDDDEILIPAAVAARRQPKGAFGKGTPTHAPASTQQGFSSAPGGSPFAQQGQQQQVRTSPPSNPSRNAFGMDHLQKALTVGGPGGMIPPQVLAAQQPSMRTAQDLLLNMLQGGGTPTGSSASPAHTSASNSGAFGAIGSGPSSSSPAGPSLLFGGVQSPPYPHHKQQPSHSNLASIWAPTPGEVGGSASPSRIAMGGAASPERFATPQGFSAAPGSQMYGQQQGQPGQHGAIGSPFAQPAAQRRGDPWGASIDTPPVSQTPSQQHFGQQQGLYGQQGIYGQYRNFQPYSQFQQQPFDR